jgi:hypothetical protein
MPASIDAEMIGRKDPLHFLLTLDVELCSVRRCSDADFLRNSCAAVLLRPTRARRQPAPLTCEALQSHSRYEQRVRYSLHAVDLSQAAAESVGKEVQKTGR